MTTIARVTRTALPVTLMPSPPRTILLQCAAPCGVDGHYQVEVPVPGLTDKVNLDVMAVRFHDNLMTTKEVNQGLHDMDLVELDQISVILRIVDLCLAAFTSAAALGAGVRAGPFVHFPCLVDGQLRTRHCGDDFEWRCYNWHFLALPREQATHLCTLLC